MNISTLGQSSVASPGLPLNFARGLGVSTCFIVAILGGLALSSSPARADVAYDESISGDLSNSGLTPTAITFHRGWNDVLGSTGRTGSVVDRDYFTFTVPTNYIVSGFDELAGTKIGGSVSFLGLEWGPQITLPTNPTSAAGLLGWTHYSATDTNIDLLASLGVPSDGSTGFSGPLGAGTYSVWIQDFNLAPIDYGFSVQLSSVPEPSTYGEIGALFLAAAVLARKKLRRAS